MIYVNIKQYRVIITHNINIRINKKQRHGNCDAARLLSSQEGVRLETTASAGLLFRHHKNE